MSNNWLEEWNKKIYKNEDGSHVGPGLQGMDFWNSFYIKSWPKFKDACSYHIPERWVDDVTKFINLVQSELKDQIKFKQIKEKWCRLTVYFESTDKDAETRMYELIQECIDKLIEKGVHPPNSGDIE